MSLRIRCTTTILGIALACATVPSAHAAFHLAVIDEVMTSYNGDSTAQFVEIRMLAAGQTFVSGTKLAAFDASGSFVGIVLTVSGNVSGGAGDRWIMGSGSLQTASGLTVDKVFNGPTYLPTGGGMVCWGAPLNQTIPSQYVDCLAYGTYTGPTFPLIGTPTPLEADGHSLRRVTSTNNNLNDFTCADPADPTNNTGTTVNLPATTPCPVCGNNATEPGEECDGTDDAACPGLCLINCNCVGDADNDGKLDNLDECSTLFWSGPTIPPNQKPRASTLILKNIDLPGSSGLVAKGFFNPSTLTPAINPLLQGAHVRLEDPAGLLYDVSIPPGAVGSSSCDPRDGWANPQPTLWKYTNKSGALDPPTCTPGSARGIFTLIVQDLTSLGPQAFKYIVKSKGDTFPVTPTHPVTDLVFDFTPAAQPSPGNASAAAIAGQCAESAFTGSPVPSAAPKPFCKRAPATGPLKKIICKGP